MMHASKRKYTDASLPEIKNIYDKIVIGGDQLWNCKVNYYNENNFLPFVEEKEKRLFMRPVFRRILSGRTLKARFGNWRKVSAM